MAIYHFSAQVISRSSGRSVVAAAAYRSGERLHDERYGKTHDYSIKNVSERAIVAPENAPAWVKNREQLWNAVEAAEKQKNAQLCREINVALPRELSVSQQRELLSAYVSEQFVARGMIADVAIHRDNPENPHAHIMLTMRPLNPDGTWGAKSRKEYVLDENGEKIKLKSGEYKSYKVPTTDWDKVETLENWRAEWAAYANRALERAGHSDRIDHRSLEAQGSDRLATAHEGPHVRQMERRGIQTDRGDLNRAVAEYNGLVVSLEVYRKEKEALAKETAPEAIVEPAERNEKQLAVLTAKAQELKSGLNQLKGELTVILNRLQYGVEQQHRIDDRNEIAKKIAILQRSRGVLGLFNKNSKEIAELERKKANLEDRIREHSRFVPSDAEAAELRAKRDQLEKKQKELLGQYQAVRNKVKSLEQQPAGQEKREPQRDRSGQQQPQQRERQAVTLRQALQALKYSAKGVPVKGVPMNLPQEDLDKALQKAGFSNRGGVEQLFYQLEGSEEKRVILFEQVPVSRDQRDRLFDQVVGVAGAILSSVDREKQRENFISQQQLKKKKRRDMER